MIYALFDSEVPKSTLMANAKLYKIGLKGECFSTWVFWKWILYGFAQSALVFYVVFDSFNWSSSPENG